MLRMAASVAGGLGMNSLPALSYQGSTRVGQLAEQGSRTGMRRGTAGGADGMRLVLCMYISASTGPVVVVSPFVSLV
jgi:hypothetical protein